MSTKSKKWIIDLSPFGFPLFGKDGLREIFGNLNLT